MVAIVGGNSLGLVRSSASVLGGNGQLGSAAVGRLGSGVTVNAVTGNLVIQNQDELLTGVGIVAAVMRTYNSLGLMDDDNGDNWRHSGQRKVEVVTAGSVLRLTDWDGSRTDFTWDAGFVRADGGSGAYVSKAGGGAYDYITYAANTWTFTDGDSLATQTFAEASAGRITGQRDATGNLLSYTYDASNRLSRITTANGEYTELVWNGNQLAQVTTSYTRTSKEETFAQQLYRMYDAAFNRTPDAYGYDVWLNGLLSGSTTLQSLADAFYASPEYQARGVGSMTNAQFAAFLYTSVLRRTAAQSEIDNWASVLNSGAQTRGQVLLAFSESPEHQGIVASLGRTAPAKGQSTRTRYTYDGQGRLASVTLDLTLAGNGTNDGKVVTYEYTYDGTSKRVASITETGSGNFVSFTYVQVGSDFRVASVTEAMFSEYLKTTTFSYNTPARRTTITDALGKVRLIDYDTAGNITAITSPADGTGAAPQVVQFGYNTNGDVTSVTDGLGKVTSYTYDAHGNVTESVDPAGNRMRYVYDNKNLLLRKVLVVNTGGLTRLPGTSVDTAFYLAAYGDILNAGEAVDPVLHYTVTGWREGRNPNAMFNTNAYLAAHPDVAAAGINPLEHWLSDGWREGRTLGGGLSTAEYIARYVNETTRYAYDSAGRLRFEVTTEGKVTEFRYNALGQKTATIQYTNNWYPVGWTLSSTDNVTEAQVAAWVAGLGSTAAIQRTDTTYDYRGNVASEVSYADLNVNRVQFSKFESGTGGWWAWQSQANMFQGGMTTATDGASGKKYMQLTYTSQNGNDVVAMVSDELWAVTGGERIAVRAGVGTSGGDSNLYLQVQFFDANAGWITEIRAAELRGQFGFNTTMGGFIDVPANAQRMRLVLYSGYTAAGTTRTFTMTEPTITQATVDQTTLPQYSAGVGQNTLSLGPLGSASYNRVTYTYDQYGQLLAKTTSGTVGSEVYTYDGLGRLLSATDLAGAVTTTAYNDSARTTTVTLANGLVKVSQHDAQGNVWTYTESGAGLPTATETYKYDKLGRLRIHGDALGFRDFTFYDEAGRKTGYMDEKGQLTEFRYDAANRLVATIQYANAMTAGAIAALYDGSLASTATITGARPAASNYDRWEWLVYDAADRVVQKIETVRGAWEGQSARVTSYSYDRAGNLDKTVESANVLSPAQVAQLMAQTPGTNLLKNPGFEGTAGWSSWNGHGIITAGSPFAGVWQDQHYLRANFTATGAGQAGSITVDGGSNFAVTPGQQLSVKTGVEGVGPVSNLNLVVWWFDANGQPMYNTQVKAVSGQQVYGTQIEGLVTVPTGAASARLEMYMTASGAGSGWFVLIEPKVSVVSQGFAANLFQNTGFDNGSYNWNQWGTSGINLQGPVTVTTDAKGRKAATANFQATSASNNSVAIYTDSVQYFAPTAEEGLSISAEVASSGAIDRIEMWVEYWDASNNWLASKQIGVARGVQPGGMQLSGFVDKGPANAKWVRVLTWAYPSAANTNASFSVRNLSVSTQPKTLNLWRNSSFEQGTQYWNQWGNAPQVTFTGSPTISTDSAGNRVIQTTFKTTDVAHSGVLFSESAQFLNLVAGQRLAVSLNVASSGPIAQTYVDVAFFDANWQHISSTGIGSVAGAQANPVQISGFVESVPANAKYARVHVHGTASATNSNITLSASGLMVTKAEAGQTVVPVFSRNYDRAPVHVAMPTGTSTDRITRNFYSKDGQLIGQLDGVGGFVQYAYDRAGRLTRTTRYANVVPSSLWFGGNFSQILGAVGTSAKDRTEYSVYDGAGRVRFRLDAQLRPTEYVYNAAGQVIRTIEYAGPIAALSSYTLTSVRSQIAQLGLSTHADTRVTRSVYDGAGRLNFTIDALGGVTSLAYDNTTSQVVRTIRYANVYTGTGDPTAAAMWAWTDGNQSAQNAITRSVYDKLGRLVYAVDAEGFITEYQYDLEGQVLKEIRYPGQYSVTDGATVSSVAAQIGGAATLPDTITKTFAYDAAGQLTDSWDGEGVRTRFEYNAFGQVTRTVFAVGTPDEAYEESVYDTAGRLVVANHAVGTAEYHADNFSYDGVGNLVYQSKNGAFGAMQTWYGYNANGQRTSQAARIDNATGVNANSYFEYNTFGEVTKTTDARGGVTISDYNRLGQVTSVTDALGYVTSYAYNPLGTLQSVSRAGAATTFLYDKLGRVTRSTDALGHFETYGYDALGNRISKTAKSATTGIQAGGTTVYAYDKRGLLISETLPVQSFDSNGNATATNIRNTYSYDAFGNLRTKIEAAGFAEARTTQYAYDKANRLKQTTGQTFHGITPVSYIYYDARGNVTSTVAPDGGRTVYYYDDLNRVTVEISPVGTYTAYTYDLSGNVATARVYRTPVGVPADGGAKHEAPGPLDPGVYRETAFTYDALGRMTSSKIVGVTSGVFNGSGWAAYSGADQDIVTRYEYDANGNVTKAIDAEGNTTWSYYDALNRKTHQVDGEGYLTWWEYNADGNVTWEHRYANKVAGTPGATAPGVAGSALDRHTSFAYDAVGNRVSESRHNVQVHDGAGGYSLTTATISYLYNGLGQVTRKTEASQDQVNYTYDVGGRLTSEARAAFVDQSGTTVTPTVDYYYDGLGNLSRTRARGSANAAERVTTYGYDAGKLRWMRDAEWQDGNVKDGKMTWYWYDQAGRVTAEYYDRFDSNGNQTRAANGSLARYEGVLTSYDAAGRAVEKRQAAWNDSAWIDGAPRLTTTYNAYGEVATVSYGGVLQQQNEYDNAGRLTATNSGDGAWKYFGYDRNGNQTVAITSAGFNLAGQGFWGALSRVGQTDVNATYTRYDKRNMATIVTEEGRQFSIGGAAQTLNTERTYNAFGEVASEKNAALAQIDYSYNAMGRLIKTESPTVQITLENGTTANVRPTEQYYYDAAGRLVATRDANNNLTRLTLLAGTGYGGSQAQVTSEIHADGGIKTTKYDIHGDAREQIDELGRQILLTYDKMGRMTQRQELRNASVSWDDLIGTYVYDGLGQQLSFSTNALYGDNQITDYDIQGRVTYARAFGGDVTQTSYAWEAGTGTAGIGTFGAWAVTTTMANGLYSVQKSDLAGRSVYKRDLGGNITSFSYDVAGRMASTTMNGMTTSVTWLNSGLVGSQVTATPGAGSTTADWTRDTATYSYDLSGNRLTEVMQREVGDYTEGYWFYWAPGEPDYQEATFYQYTTTIKNASATYDALGRMRTWSEAGTATSPTASIANEYDAAGNVRRTNSSYRALDANGAASASPQVRDYWFRYDSMNRVVINQGVLDTATSTIVRGAQIYGAGGGQEIAYNQAGQRTSVTVTNAYASGYYGYTYADTSELYSYDEAGRLIQSREVAGTPAAGPGTLRSIYGYDLLGRQTSQSDYNAAGTQVVYSRTASFDTASRLTSDYTSNLKTDGKTYTSSTSYSYYGSQGYMLGAVTSQSSSNWVSGGSTTYSSTTNTYVWFDGALQSTISYTPNTSQPGTKYTTTFGYNSLGQLTSAYIADGKPHSVTFTNDELGQIVRRDETAVSGQTGAPHEVWYRFNGRQLGYTGNNGTTDMSMAASISDRQVVSPTNQGTFRNKQMVGSSYADFAQNYDPINSFSQGSAGGTYTVQRGDTLQSIAQNLWGDSSLWYKIAEANGLGASSGLVEGQRLTLPTGVIKNTHNAGTSNPYNPAEAMGDLSPSTSPKPKGRKCGVFGAILLALVAIAVAAWAGPGVINFFANVGAALGGTVGAAVGTAVGMAATGAIANAASQAVGLATGIQDKFSWKAVGSAALRSLFVPPSSGNFVTDVVRGVLTETLYQGVAVATGLQKKFDWAGVAAAGISHGVGAQVDLALPQTNSKLGNIARQAVVGAASSIAYAATRSAITGENFGQNVIASLPNVVAQALYKGGGLLLEELGKLADTAPAAANPTTTQQKPNIATPEFVAAIEARNGTVSTDSQGNVIVTGRIRPEVIVELLGSVNQRTINRSGVDEVLPVTGVENLFWIDTQDNKNPDIDWGVNIESLPSGVTYSSTYFGYSDENGVRRIISAKYDGEVFGSVLYVNGTANARIVRGNEVVNFRISEGAKLSANSYLTAVQAANMAALSRTNQGTISAWTPSLWDGYRTNRINLQRPSVDQISRGHSQWSNGSYLSGGANIVFGNIGYYSNYVTGGFATVLSLGREGQPYANPRDLQDAPILEIGVTGLMGMRSATVRGATSGAGVDLQLKYKPGWTAAQRSAADLKVQILTDSDTVVSQVSRSGTSAASRYRSAGNQIPAGSDIDHAVDLQLGGTDTVSNMWPLNSSVNRSLGAQIQHQIRNLPPGTVINRVTIGDR